MYLTHLLFMGFDYSDLNGFVKLLYFNHVHYIHQEVLRSVVFVGSFVRWYVCSLTCLGGRISRKRFRDWGSILLDHLKWHMANWMVTWSMTSHDPLRAGGFARAWLGSWFLTSCFFSYYVLNHIVLFDEPIMLAYAFKIYLLCRR